MQIGNQPDQNQNKQHAAVFEKKATRKAIPTAKLRAAYSQAIPLGSAMVLSPGKLSGLSSAINGPINMGRVSITMMMVNQTGSDFFIIFSFGWFIKRGLYPFFEIDKTPSPAIYFILILLSHFQLI
jgi:hypothetical protein